MPTFTPLATSTFTRPDESPILEVNKWTELTPPGGVMQITSNSARPSSFASDAGALYTTLGQSSNQYARANFTCTGGSVAGVGPCLLLRNAVQTVNTLYRFSISKKATGNATIARFINNAYTELVTWTQPFTDGDEFTFAVEGTSLNQIILYAYDSVLTEIRQHVDSNVIAGPNTGYSGIGYSSIVTACTLDNFECGFFSASVPPDFKPLGILDSSAFPDLLDKRVTNILVPKFIKLRRVK